MLRGTCWLLRAGADPLWLSAGDIVLLPREFGHALADHPDRPLTDFRASRKPGVDLAGDSPSAIAPGAVRLSRSCCAGRTSSTGPARIPCWRICPT